MPARAAFPLGRLMVAPSRAESLPYIILETAAAAVPLITTRVGGIPEVFGPQSGRLVPPGDAAALAGALRSALADPAALRNETLTLRERVQAEFSADVMTEGVLAAYREAIVKFQS
jgi:glycosyltransferase involved in cell wall biosynthesis